MKIPHLTSIVLAFGLLIQPLPGQEDTAHQRDGYEKINAEQESMRKATATRKLGQTLTSHCAWKTEQGKIRKIVATKAGGEVTEYDLEEEKPLFVFRSFKKAT